MLLLSPLMPVFFKKSVWITYGDFSTRSKYITRDGGLMDEKLQQQQYQHKNSCQEMLI